MPSGDLSPLRRPSTVDQLAAELRTAIMAGTLAPGEQLGETDLAARFAISRGPLREAMQRLVSEGILVAVRNRGVFVVELHDEDVVDVYRARGAIEGAALSLVLAQRREATYAALGPAIEAMTAAARRDDAPALRDADQDFHDVLVACSGSTRLDRAMRTLVVETRMCLSKLPSPRADLHRLAAEHIELRNAIRTASAQRVHELMAAHMDDAVGRIVGRAALHAAPPAVL